MAPQARLPAASVAHTWNDAPGGKDAGRSARQRYSPYQRMGTD